MNINEMLKEVNYQRQAVWIDAMPSLLQSLETAYPIPLGGRCLPVAARLLLMDLTSEANAESDRGLTIQRIVNRQEVLDCFRAVRVAIAFDENSFDEFLSESWDYIHRRFHSFSSIHSIHQNNPDLSRCAYTIAEAKTFYSRTDAENAVSNLITEEFRFTSRPFEDHFFRDVCKKYAEHLKYESPAVDVLKAMVVKEWQEFLWVHFKLQHKNAIRYLRDREVLLPSTNLDPRNETAFGGDTNGRTMVLGDTNGRTVVLGDTDEKKTTVKIDTGEDDNETLVDLDPFEIDNPTKHQLLSEAAFNQLCAGMTANQKNRCLLRIMTYLLSKTAYFDPDMFQWLTDKLSNSWERLKEDYQEAQTTLRHEEDSKREASDKTNQMLISLNRSIEDAGNSGYFEVDEIRRLVLDGRRCFHNQHRGQENNANVLNREIVTHIDLIRSGNSEGGLLSNFNELSRNLFNISIRNQPVSALETRIYHIDVLLPHAEDEMRNELEKQKLGLKVKLAGFRHEDSRVHYVKFFGPSRDSNLGRYKLHKGYLSTNPGARSIVKDGVLWVRSDRQVFEILSANGLVEGNYINNQSTINRNRELGKRLASSLVFIGMIYQRRLDLFLDISEWNIVKLCFETYFQSNRNYSWDERAETGYELKNYDQLLNIEWIVGQFRNQDFQLRLRTPEAIQLWRDHNSELCQNNNNLTLIVG